MQTNYNLNPAPAVEGMVAEDPGELIVTKLAQGAVPVGKLCAPGTDAQGQPSVTTASTAGVNPGQVIPFPVGAVASPLDPSLAVGIPIYDSSREPYDTTNSYSDKDSVPVMLRGTIWLKPDAAVTAERAVYVWVNPTAPGVTDPIAGTFTTSTQGGKASLVPNAKWVETTTGAGLARARVRFD